MKRLALGACLTLVACGGGTEGGLVSFLASAGGPVDAVAGSPLPFTSGSGYHVVLTRARLHLGAVYLNETVPSSGAAESSCILPGVYAAEVFGPLDLDLLSPALVRFPGKGAGIAAPAKEAEVWLTGGDINTIEDSTVILDVAGTAEKGGVFYPFTGAVTIGKNRLIPVQNPALPGSSPICHQRIVTPIPIDVLPIDGGSLELRIDPRGMWNGLDFSAVPKIADAPPRYQIPDAPGGAGGALFKGLFANSGVYSFTWKNKGE